MEDKCMDFNGEIIFSISDSKNISLDLGFNFSPTRVVKEGEIIALGRKASKNRWLYEKKFKGEKEYIENMDRLTELLMDKIDDIWQAIDQYEDVSIDVYLRSELAQIGFSMPAYILKRIATIGCSINFDILSFGMVEQE